MKRSDALPPLAALRAFEGAARLGSFQAAAEALSLTPPAVSHQIKSLELELGQALFVRLHRRVTLSDAGRRLQGFVQRGFDELRRGVAAIRLERETSTLRVSSAPTFAMTFLAPRVDEFERANPGLTLKLEISNAIADFDIEPIDVGIRVSRRLEAGLYAEELMPIIAAPVCTPKLAMQLKTFRDLDGMTRIVVAQDPNLWRAWRRAAAAGDGEAGRELHFETLTVGLQAALEGLGVIITPLHLVAHHLRSGQLSAPFAEVLRSKQSYRLVCRRGEEDLPKIQRFRRWLRRELATTLGDGGLASAKAASADRLHRMK